MKYLSLLICILFTLNLSAQDKETPASGASKTIYIQNYLLTDPIEVEKPQFANVENDDGAKFEAIDLIKYNYLEDLDFRPGARDDFEWKELELYRWIKKEAKNNILSREDSKKEYDICYAAFYLQNTEWTELELTVKSGQMIEVYVDGEFKKSKYSFERKGKEESISFNTFIDANNHVVLVKVLNSKNNNDQWSLQCQAKTHNTENTLELISTTDAKLFLDVEHHMQGIDISSAEISAAGDYYFVDYDIKMAHQETQNIIEVREAANDNTIQVYYGNDVSSVQWSPQGNKLSYMTQLGSKSWIWEDNLDLFKTYPIVKGLSEVTDFVWSPNGEYLVLSNDSESGPGNDGNLYMLDVLSHVKTPLIFGDQAIVIQDISPKGRYILFSKNTHDENQVRKEIMYQFNTKTGKLETLWNKVGESRASYSPNVKQLLVIAGPSFFGDEGINVNSGPKPNEYDTQAYLYTFKTQKVEAISKDFTPSIIEAYWHPMNVNYIYFRVAERSFTNVYQYTLKTKYFDLLPMKVDAVNSFSFSKTQPLFVYFGNSINTSEKLYVAHLELGKIQLIEHPEEKIFEDVKFGKTEEWNFKNENGVSIEGRVYYPPNFDETKKYPLLVYYYGGANITERNFRGGYPINAFAAKGYVVYMLQPTGAIGFGQEFSAQHDDWGELVIEEIIKGSQEFCNSHRFIDDSKVGCLGAGYGGYLTSYLINYTDFFASAISHYGISSISSYWNDYEEEVNYRVSLANDYLWNNDKVYEGLTLDMDKVSTPVLLLKGNTLLDVPNDDAQQFYAALQQNGKEAVLIDFNDKDLNAYEKNVLWQKTIMAYFDKTLKGQPDWWFHLYPKKK